MGARLNILLIYAAGEGRFSADVLQSACAGLRAGGHEVRVRDLYAEQFVPAMSLVERDAYHGETPVVSAEIEHHAADVRWAEVLVFLYPTVWGGLPAIMKGWLERVMVPGVAFRFDDRSGKVRPTLGHIRKIVGIASYPGSRRAIWRMGDGGRRTLLRALRLVTGWRTRTCWMAMYDLDAATTTQRQEFATRIQAELARL